MLRFKVEFYDAKGKLLSECRVQPGQAAPAPKPPRAPKGCRFDRWEPQVSFVQSNLKTFAVYTPKEYLVMFLSETGDVLKREYVEHGQDAVPPQYSPFGRPVRWNGTTRNIRRNQAFCAVVGEQIA